MMSTLLPCISTHATAQISSADRGAITQCLNASHTKNHCVGIVADACIKATSRDSQVEDAKACAVRERNVWAERLRRKAKTKRYAPLVSSPTRSGVFRPRSEKLATSAARNRTG